MQQLNHSSHLFATMDETASDSLGTMVDYTHRLELALKHANETPKGLQEHLGVSYQAMKKLTDGISKSLSAENHVRAAKFLGINSFWLATGEGEMLEVRETKNYSTEPIAPLLARSENKDNLYGWPFNQLSPSDFNRMTQHQRDLVEAYAQGLLGKDAAKKSA